MRQWQAHLAQQGRRRLRRNQPAAYSWDRGWAEQDIQVKYYDVRVVATRKQSKERMRIIGVGIQLVFGYFTKFPGRVFKAQHIGVVLVLIKGRSFASE